MAPVEKDLSQEPTRPPNDDMPTSYTVQFNALREEILKRAEFEHQLVGFTLAAAGTLAAIGLATDGTFLALLVYPLLTTFVAISWLFNNFRIQQIGYYILERMEPKFEGLGWEDFLQSPDADKVRPIKGWWNKWLSAETVAKGIFCASPIIFILLAMVSMLQCLVDPTSSRDCTGLEFFEFWGAVVLLVVDIILIALTSYFVFRLTAKPVFLIREQRSQQ